METNKLTSNKGNLIEGPLILKPMIFNDQRGCFYESWNESTFYNEIEEKIIFFQDNHSISESGVLRGLQYQLNPHSQTKLVRVSKGAVLDVVVDLRKDSPTFGKHIAVELTSENKKQLFIPSGFAHGFIVLEDETRFVYKVDNYYFPDSERGIAFNDPELGIDWKLNQNDLKLSMKDSNLTLFSKAEYF